MTDTPNLGMTYLEGAQAQKHTAVNDALRRLDGIVQAHVADKDLTAPPGSPTTGAGYLVAAGGSGLWAGQDDNLAVWDGTAWFFYAPKAGWFVYVVDEATYYAYDGAGWASLAAVMSVLPSTGGTLTGDLVFSTASATIDLGTGGVTGPHAVNFYDGSGAIGVSFAYRTTPDTLSVEDGTAQSMLKFPQDRADGIDTFADWDFNSKYVTGVARLGVGGATPDATNTFAFYGTDMLFNSGGNINAKFNKNASGDDASFTFQQGFTTYALMGLLGDNDFTLKVGSSFTAALIAKETTGEIQMPEGFSTGSSAVQLGGKAFTVAGEEGASLVLGNYQSMGNGDTNVKGVVVPFNAKLVAGTMSISDGAATSTNTLTVTIDGVEQASYTVSGTYAGSGNSNFTSDWTGGPLAVSAGTAINLKCTAAGGGGDVVSCLFLVFD